MFPCERCGSCCAFIGCEHLGEDNLCTIYETRPDVCKVGSAKDKSARTKEMTTEEYYELNKDFCKIFQKWRKP